MIWRAPSVVLALFLALSRPAFAQCPDGTAPPCRVDQSVAPSPKSIAVLYFQTVSPDSNDAYLAAGLTEQLISRIGQLERFKVKSASSVARYRGATKDPSEIGLALRVSYVVKGVVFPRPTALRVSVELWKSSGDRMWGADYNRSAADLLALVLDISTEIATEIAGQLQPAEREVLRTFPTHNPQAYQHFVRGLFLQTSREAGTLLRALREFEAAVQLDTMFARAFARIGITCGLLMPRNSGVPADSLFTWGLAATDRALALEPTLADGWLARGRLLGLRYSPFYEGVLAAYERAIALDSNNAEAYHFYATHLAVQHGNITRSRAAYERAVNLEPDRAVSLDGLALTHFSARQFADARRWSDSAVAIAPGNSGFRLNRATIRFALADTAGARADALAALRDNAAQSRPVLLGLIALLDQRRGDTLAARLGLEALLAQPGEPNAERGMWVATLLVERGQKERALEYLERVRPRQGFGFPLLLSYVWVDPLRSEPRFQKLLEESRPK